MDKITLETIEDYREFLPCLEEIPEEERKAICRHLCKTDLFFLLWYALKRKDIAHPWLLARCREVQENPDAHLDLWARSHYKSTVITFAKSIQDILINPDIKIGIFSHTRPIAKAFLIQIKRELEQNEILKYLFDDVLWEAPHKEAPKWSDETGIIVKRNSNPKESTVEAWGVVEGQPVSKHFDIIVYDDVVTAESVTTPEMVNKTVARWELSLSLLSNTGICRYIGTRYAFNDLYRVLMERQVATPRIYPATENGTSEGEPILLSKEQLQKKRKEQGVYTFSCQMLQNPIADTSQGFKKDWLHYYECGQERLMEVSQRMNKYILVDPASSKKKGSDYSVFVVIGCNSDNNYYLLDGVRDRLNLPQRKNTLFELQRKWSPHTTGYEKYGMMADVEYILEEQDRLNYRFQLMEIGGKLAKEERIKRLVPIFEFGRFYLPFKLSKLDCEGKQYDFIQKFIEDEYLLFPSSVHDDMLDAIARIFDIPHEFPLEEEEDAFTVGFRPQEYDQITGEPL